MNPEKLKEVQNGNDAHDLLSHPGWKLIEESFNQDKDEALVKLVEVDPNDTKEIMRLQNTIHMYIELVDRVRQLVSIGDQARTELEFEEQQEN